MLREYGELMRQIGEACVQLEADCEQESADLLRAAAKAFALAMPADRPDGAGAKDAGNVGKANAYDMARLIKAGNWMAEGLRAAVRPVWRAAVRPVGQ